MAHAETCKLHQPPGTAGQIYVYSLEMEERSTEYFSGTRGNVYCVKMLVCFCPLSRKSVRALPANTKLSNYFIILSIDLRRVSDYM